MFVPKPVAEKANAYVMAQPENRNPKFTPGVGWVAKESGNILRFVSSTPSHGRRIGTVGQAFNEAKAKKRAARIERQKARQRRTNNRQTQQLRIAHNNAQAANAMRRVAMAGKKTAK